MTVHPVQKRSWRVRAFIAGIRLNELATLTGRSASSVYKYAAWADGKPRSPSSVQEPPDEWLEKVEEVLAGRSVPPAA